MNLITPPAVEHPVRRLRRMRGIRFTELARRAKLSPSSLAAIERGSTRHPSPETLASLSTALQVTTVSLQQAIEAWLAEQTPPTAELPLPERFRTFVDWRQATGLDQGEFARAIRVSHGTLSAYEAGRRRGFSTAIGLGLMKAYGVDVAFVDQLAALPPRPEEKE